MADEFCGVAGLAGLAAWRASADPGRRRVLLTALAGLALGMAVLTRATGALFLLALLLAALLTRTARRRAAAAVALALLPALAWSLRSSRLEGRPVFVHSLGAYNFWLGEAADRFGFAPDPGRARAAAHRLMAEEAGLSPAATTGLWHVALTPPETARLESALAKAARRRVLSAPASYARRVLAGIAWFWVRADTLRTTCLYAIAVLPFLAGLLLGARPPRAGAWDPLHLALLLAVALHVLLYAAVCPMARYSVAVYACAAPLVALGWTRLSYSGGAGGP